MAAENNEPKWKKVLKALQSRPFITNMDIVRIASTTCPHDAVRKLRNRGYNVLDRIPEGANHKEYYLQEVEQMEVGL